MFSLSEESVFQTDVTSVCSNQETLHKGNDSPVPLRIFPAGSPRSDQSVSSSVVFLPPVIISGYSKPKITSPRQREPEFSFSHLVFRSGFAPSQQLERLIFCFTLLSSLSNRVGLDQPCVGCRCGGRGYARRLVFDSRLA